MQDKQREKLKAIVDHSFLAFFTHDLMAKLGTTAKAGYSDAGRQWGLD